MSTAGAKPETPSSGEPGALTIISFSATNFGKSGFWVMADIFCLVFATDTLGIEPALAGTIILITLIWDAISDPMVGAAIDRVPGLNLSYGTLILWSAPLCALFLIMIFSVQLFPAGLHIVTFGIFLLLFRSAFTLLDIPDNALFSRVARTRSQRLFGASVRKLMATVASVIVSATTAWTFSDSPVPGEGIRILIAICIGAPIAALSLWYGAARVKHWDHAHSLNGTTTRRMTFQYLSNTSVLALTTHMFLSTLGMSLFMSALVYHARFVLGEDAWFATAMSALLVAQALGVVLWGAVATRLSTYSTIMAAAGFAVLAIVIFFFASSTLLMVTACAAFGACAGGLNTLRWALAPGVIDHASGVSGPRDEAAIMALFSLSIKSAIGLGALSVGTALTYSGYQAGERATGFQAILFGGSVALLAATALLLSILPLRDDALRRL